MSTRASVSVVAACVSGASSKGVCEGERASWPAVRDPLPCVLTCDICADMICSEMFAVGDMGLGRIDIRCMGCMREKSAAWKYLLVLVEGSGRGASELLLSEQACKQ